MLEILPVLEAEPLHVLADVLADEHGVLRERGAELTHRLGEGDAVRLDEFGGDTRERGEVGVHRRPVGGFHVHVQQAPLELVDERDLRNLARVVLLARRDALDVDGEVLRDVLVVHIRHRAPEDG